METKCLNAFTGNQNYYVLLTFEENNIISSVSDLPDILNPRNTSHRSLIRKLYDAMRPKHKRGEEVIKYLMLLRKGSLNSPLQKSGLYPNRGGGVIPV